MELNWKTVCYTAGGLVFVTVFVLVGIVAFPALVGGNDAYIVTSGSMSPTIEAGDVIVTQDVSPEEIESGDVVTFRDENGADGGTLTHRVVEVREENGDRYFKTKGDANEDPDEGYVPAEYAWGTLHLHLPYVGYLLLFARSPLGLFTLVVLPGLFLVGSGCWQLLREFGYAPDGDRLLESVLAPEAVDDGSSPEGEPGDAAESGVPEAANDPVESEVER